jgi:type I restriction enzyme S subunit
MEVKSGYKQTEVGIIPQEWKVAPLSCEIDRLEAGVSVNSVDEELHSYAHEQAVLKTSAVAGGQFLPYENKKIAPRDIGRAKLNPRFDTIIISRMNTPDLVGECGYVFADFPNLFLPDRLWMTRSRTASDVCVRWLNYLLSSQPYKTRIKGLATGTSGSMKNIGKDALLAMPIPYLDGDEQRAIAEALSDVDALLTGLDRLVAKNRDLKQAAMQQLLTGQTRLPGFHGEWEASCVGREFEVKLGKMLDAEKNVGIPKPYLGNKAVQWDHIDISDLPTVPMSRSDMERFRLKKGDLLVCEGGDVGRAAIWEAQINECYYQKALHRLRPLRGFDSRLMVAFLRLWSDRGLFSNYVTQTSIAHLPREKFIEMPMPVPPPSEQTAIAEVLTDMDAELAALEQRREKTRALKQAMMQELLTGKTRLV